MKTSSRIILENIKIDKELRINVALINDKQLTSLFNNINHHIDELNNTKMNEHKKIFTLETLIKELIDFSNKTFFKLYYENNEKAQKKRTSKEIKVIFRHQKRC